MRLSLVFVITMILCAGISARAQTRPPLHYRAVTGLQLEVGQPAPDFQGVTNLASFRGKALLISFYTEHCTPCIREIPVLNALRLHNPELQVLAITPDSASETARYAKVRHLTWPIVTPGENYVFDKLGVRAFPTFAILDAEGRLLGATYGSDLDLGGVDGYATHAGIAAWLETSAGIKVK